MAWFRCLTLLLLLAACSGEAAPSAASAALAALVAEDWEARLADDPLFATSVGRADYASVLPDVGPAALARAAERDRALLRRASELSSAGLSSEERDTLLLLRRDIDGRVRRFEFGEHEVPLNSDSGFHTALLRWPAELPTASAPERASYTARLAAAPTYIGQHIENMRQGLARGMTLPRAIARGQGGLGAVLAMHTAERYLSAPEESLFFAPFRAAEVGPAERAAALPAVRGVVRALAELQRFLDEEYAERCRASLAAADLPDGRAYYEFCVRWFTTLETTPEKVHEQGRDEVARIRAEMERVKGELGFGGALEELFDVLRRAPEHYARTPDELLAFAARRCKRIDSLLPRWFGVLPRQPYGVEPVPADLAPRYTTGRYVPAPAGSTRAGTYWVNTYDLPSRPLFAMPALTLHEAVPGHHLQIALAQELTHLPPFRRHLYVDAFGEGWALYCEWLGVEMGVYDGPYEELGRLVYEMWRACRLVVDTGLHTLGWSRQQAIDYLAQNTALSLHECTTEVDRYCAWPGQALAYKTGELELRRLRREAEARLGPAFDVRRFHDTVLGAGTVTLEVLAQRVASTWAPR